MNHPLSALASISPASAVEDVQNRVDTRGITIDKVGIRGLRHPLQVRDRTGDIQNTISRVDLYVDLSADNKGTHMSRFVELLGTDGHEFSVDNFAGLLTDMTRLLDAQKGYITVRFPYFVNKRAPVSGVRSLMDYEVTMHGQVENTETRISIEVCVPVTSLCPCSKAIADYGAHNQRSHVTVNARTRGGLWIEDIIDIVEAQASCDLYGTLKRTDEKYVTERAYDNPKFVEDMVRDVAAILNSDDRVAAYSVASENFESIHNHSAYARIEYDKDASQA